jgi:hypothetical protein
MSACPPNRIDLQLSGATSVSTLGRCQNSRWSARAGMLTWTGCMSNGSEIASMRVLNEAFLSG